MNESEINIDLIGKYLAGEASPEEAMAIDRWRFGSIDAAKEFEEIAAVWNKIKNEAAYIPVDSSVAWKSFSQKIIDKNKPAKRLKLFPRLAAAVVLLSVIATATFFFIHQKNKQNIPVSVANTAVTKDTLQLKLAYNSLVTLKRGSSFKSNKSAFNSKREGTLSGNAEFDVTHINGNPFIVNTNGIGIKVIGTIFNVNNDDNKVSVSVKRGIVLVYHGKDTLAVKAGSAILFDKQTKELAFTENKNSTNTATFIFNDAPMSEVKKALENAYQVNVVFDNDLLSQCRISTQFQDKSLQYVLDIIATSLNIQYKRENNTVHFYGHACN